MEENYMKKIIALGAAAAVLSLTAVAASAAIAPVMTPAAPVAGDTVTVEIVANGMTQDSTAFKVVASDNLTLTANDPGTGLFNPETGKYAWAGTAVPADGTVLLTLTYTVDAAADEEVTVALEAGSGATDISVDTVAAVVVDGESTDVPDTDTIETTEESYEEITSEEEPGLATTDEGTVDEGTVDEGNTDADTDNKGNPDTGIALAVVPAVLAGAAIVVAKKRK